MLFNESTADHLGWKEIQAKLSEEALTPLGKAACLHWLPLGSPQELQATQARHQQLSRLISEGIFPPLEPVEDIEADLERAKKQGILAPEAIQRIGRAMLVSSQVRRFLLNEGHRVGGALTELARGTHDLSENGRDLLDAFDDSGSLRDSASPELGPLRRSQRSIADGIRKRLEAMIRNPKIVACLREPYITQRGDRYVLPVRADAHEQPFTGIVHDTSQSGATLFIEPSELVEDGNRLKIAQASVLEEERKILAGYTQEIAALQDSLAENLRALTEFDCLQATERLGRKIHGRMIPVEGTEIRLLQARHPLMQVSGDSVVPNDICLSYTQRCLVVTGPNAGGKTVVLKTVGIISLMAQSGLPVPVGEGSRIGWFETLQAVIGDAQDIRRGLSTFSAHLEAIAQILRTSGPKTLVLLDEVAADTDPRHGAALAIAILETLVEQGVSTVITTHFDELKLLAYQDERFVNASVGFDLHSMAPTYVLHPDIPGRSLTLELAQRLGIDEKILSAATQRLQGGERQLDEVLINLEKETQAVMEIRRQLERQVSECELRVQEHTRAASELRKTKVELLAASQKQIFGEIATVRKELAGAIEAFKKAPSMKTAVDANQQLIRLQNQIEQQSAEVGPDAQAPSTEHLHELEQLKPGDAVLLKNLGKQAEVMSVDSRTGMVAVRFGTMRTRVAVEQLKILSASTESRSHRRPPSQEPSTEPAKMVEIRTSQNTLDLRGQRVDDALEELDKFLDRLFGAGTSLAFIIHGHGTGAIKAAVRDNLRKSPYAQHFRSGTPEEGGDGVTVVKLK